MVICLERDADLHMAQLVPLPLTVSCFSKIQIGFTFLVPAHPGSPGHRAIKRVCVCVLFLSAFYVLLRIFFNVLASRNVGINVTGNSILMIILHRLKCHVD